ncbi:MAG: hypothetical protein ACRDKI_10575 [Solirubrobacterales bacterium]
MGSGSGQSFDQLKRAFMDLVNELHARKLAVPAAVVLVAIFAAVFMLPKAPAPPPPANTAPVADTSTQKVDSEAVVKLKLVGVSKLEDKTPLTGSANPFGNRGGTVCVQVGSSPKKFECLAGGYVTTYTCLAGQTEGICGDIQKGATGETGAGGGSTQETGGTPTPEEKKTPTHKKTTYYVVDVTLDGRTHNNVIAGASLPNETSPLVYFAGVTGSSNDKALFIAGDGVTVTGASADSAGNFSLTKGKSATLTDAGGVQHSFKLKSISKVTK